MAIVFIFTLAVLSTTGIFSRTIVRDLVEENALSLVQHQSRLISLWQKERISDLEQMANSALIESLVWDDIEPYLQRQVEEAPDYYLIFFVATPDGNYNTTALRDAGNISDRAYFPPVLAGETVISEPLVSRSTGQRIVVVATPIWNADASEVVGVLGLSVDLEELFHGSQELMLSEVQESVYLVDENGSFILHYNPEMIMSSRIQDLYPNWDELPSASGSFSITEDGLGYRTFYQRLSGPSGWTVAVRVPTSYFNEPVNRLIRNLLIVSVIGFALALWSGSWFASTITDPIIELNKIFKRGAEGELTVRAEVVSTDEIGETKASFNRMMDTIGSITYYDPLTGLPNRQQFMDNLEHALKNNTTVILGLVSIRDLSELKAFLGPDITDKVLISLAEQLKGLSDQNLGIARISEAEFGLIIPSGANAVLQVIDRLDHLLTNPLKFEGDELNVRLFGGISISDDKTLSVTAFYQQAQAALYEAEHTPDEPLKLYNPSIHHALLDKLSIQSEIRTAFEQEQFAVYYQPVVDLKTNTVSGKEALIRWNHPTRGLLTPGDFLQAIEQGGYIEELGEYVLHEVCVQHEKWSALGFNPGWVSVNISANHFRSPLFPRLVRSVLTNYNLPANLLRLEITEDTMLSPTPEVLHNFQELREMGIRIAIDDFGTMYSSLQYLVRYPMETLKIDKTFVDEVDKNPRIHGLVKSIVGMGMNLSMTIVAEGVERLDQLNLLASMGCDEAQGYLFSHPLHPSQYLKGLQGATELALQLDQNNY